MQVLTSFPQLIRLRKSSQKHKVADSMYKCCRVPDGDAYAAVHGTYRFPIC